MISRDTNGEFSQKVKIWVIDCTLSVPVNKWNVVRSIFEEEIAVATGRITADQSAQGPGDLNALLRIPAAGASSAARRDLHAGAEAEAAVRNLDCGFPSFHGLRDPKQVVEF
jgi:hypothetical protein